MAVWVCPLGYCWVFHFLGERLIRTLVAHTGCEQHPYLASDFASQHKSASESLIKNGSVIPCQCDWGDTGNVEDVNSLFGAEGLSILNSRGCSRERGWIWKQWPLKQTGISIWHKFKGTTESWKLGFSLLWCGFCFVFQFCGWHRKTFKLYRLQHYYFTNSCVTWQKVFLSTHKSIQLKCNEIGWWQVFEIPPPVMIRTE